MDMQNVGYYYIMVQHSNGTVNGYRAHEQPHYNDVMECFVFMTVEGSTVWLPSRNIVSVEWRIETPPQGGKED